MGMAWKNRYPSSRYSELTSMPAGLNERFVFSNSLLYTSPFFNSQHFAQVSIGIFCVAYPFDVAKIISWSFIYFDDNVDRTLIMPVNGVPDNLCIAKAKGMILFDQVSLVFFKIALDVFG
jgi:hypothetical protein